MFYKQLLLIYYCLFIINAAVGMNENTKYFLKVEKEKIAISQEGIKKSLLLKKLTETKKDVIFDATTNEAVIPFSSSLAVNPGVKNTTLFAQLCEGKKPTISQEQLPLFIYLAEHCQVDKSLTEPLKKTFLDTLKSTSDEDYVQFLSGKGFLWKTMLMIPHKILDSLKWRKHLMKPILSTSVYDIQNLGNGLLAVHTYEKDSDGYELLDIYDDTLHFVKKIPANNLFNRIKNGFFTVENNCIKIFDEQKQLITSQSDSHRTSVTELQNDILAVEYHVYNDNEPISPFRINLYDKQLKKFKTLQGCSLQQFPQGTCTTSNFCGWWHNKKRTVTFFDKEFTPLKIVHGQITERLHNGNVAIWTRDESNNSSDETIHIYDYQGDVIQQLPGAKNITQLTNNVLAVEYHHKKSIDILDEKWKCIKTLPGRSIHKLNDGSLAILHENDQDPKTKDTRDIYDQHLNLIKTTQYSDIKELDNGRKALYHCIYTHVGYTYNHDYKPTTIVDAQWNTVHEIPYDGITNLKNNLYVCTPLNTLNRLSILDHSFSHLKTIDAERWQELPYDRLAIFSRPKQDLQIDIFNDMSLSFGQTVLTTALRMFKPNTILAKKKNSDEPLGENPKLLSLVASLPVSSLQLSVQPVVKKMIKNFEEALKCKKFLANKPYREEQFTKIKRLHTILEQKNQGLTEFNNLSQKYS